MIKDLIIIGAGGHAAEIDEYIRYNHKTGGKVEYRLIGLLDDNPENYKRYRFSAPLLGGVSDHFIINNAFYVIGIAGIQYRKPFVEKYISDGAKFVSIIHRSAYISESAVIGEGCVIGPNVNIGPNVQIGKFTLINARCSIGHDSVVGDYNMISPNTCLSGFSRVGDENLFGINCATLPAINVGNRNKISAGMILDTNISDDTVIFYRYKERVIAIPKTKE
jgi:sugar O-acyltransferase (sialic acid O-acetyltransferase NeuD family)